MARPPPVVLGGTGHEQPPLQDGIKFQYSGSTMAVTILRPSPDTSAVLTTAQLRPQTPCRTISEQRPNAGSVRVDCALDRGSGATTPMDSGA